MIVKEQMDCDSLCHQMFLPVCGDITESSSSSAIAPQRLLHFCFWDFAQISHIFFLTYYLFRSHGVFCLKKAAY